MTAAYSIGRTFAIRLASEGRQTEQNARRRLVTFATLAAMFVAGCETLETPEPGNIAASPSDVSRATVTVQVDATARRQVMEGFGATTWSLTFGNGTIDNLPPVLRARALDAVYNQVKLTTGNVLIGGDVTGAGFELQNDNDDPQRFNWSAFEVDGMRVIKDKLVAPASAFGADGLFPSNKIDLRFKSWLRELRRVDYQRYLDECAEFVLAGLIQWRELMGSEPRYHALFNEALTGNRELRGGSPAEVIDIIKRAGERLRREGFAKVRFVVPSEETVTSSFELAAAILADPEARQYVGAIAYHPYPYRSTYSDVRNILATSGVGRPDSGEIAARTRLRDLAARHGLPESRRARLLTELDEPLR